MKGHQRDRLHSLDMGKDATLNARCTSEQKSTFERASQQLGYESLSDFVVDTLQAVAEPVNRDGWESRRLFLEKARIVALDRTDQNASPVLAFDVVAPAAFWEHLERLLS